MGLGGGGGWLCISAYPNNTNTIRVRGCPGCFPLRRKHNLRNLLSAGAEGYKGGRWRQSSPRPRPPAVMSELVSPLNTPPGWLAWCEEGGGAAIGTPVRPFRGLAFGQGTSPVPCPADCVAPIASPSPSPGVVDRGPLPPLHGGLLTHMRGARGKRRRRRCGGGQRTEHWKGRAGCGSFPLPGLPRGGGGLGPSLRVALSSRCQSCPGARGHGRERQRTPIRAVCPRPVDWGAHRPRIVKRRGLGEEGGGGFGAGDRSPLGAKCGGGGV